MRFAMESRYFRIVVFVFVAGSAILLQAQETLTEKAEKIEALLKAGKFDQAEPLASECLQQVPDEIYFRSQLEMALNGKTKYQEADDLADATRKLWKSKYKEQWLAKGAPVAESSWSRVIVTSDEYYLIGTEYFMPHHWGRHWKAFIK
jgi:hypothetical protein